MVLNATITLARNNVSGLGHLTTFFHEITFRRSKYCIEICKARLELPKLSRNYPVIQKLLKQFLNNPSTCLRSIFINLPTIFGTCLSHFIINILPLFLKKEHVQGKLVSFENMFTAKLLFLLVLTLTQHNLSLFLLFQLSPLQMHTTLRGTFNATLNNPVAMSYDDGLERRSPSKQAFLLGV